MAASQPTSRNALYRSAVIAVTMQWLMRFIGLISVFILARLLNPEDFGIMGLAVAALALVELLGAVGLWQALLRIKEWDREHLDTAWTIQLIVFGTMGLLALATAPLIGHLYGQPALTAVLAASVRAFPGARARQYRGGRVRPSARLRPRPQDADRLAPGGLRRDDRRCPSVPQLLGARSDMVARADSYAIATYIAHPFRPRLSLKRRAELLGTSLWIFPMP